MPERGQVRVSGAQDGRSERPATGHAEPRAGLSHRSQRERNYAMLVIRTFVDSDR
jgi:hypothetical protein